MTIYASTVYESVLMLLASVLMKEEEFWRHFGAKLRLMKGGGDDCYSSARLFSAADRFQPRPTYEHAPLSKRERHQPSMQEFESKPANTSVQVMPTLMNSRERCCVL